MRARAPLLGLALALVSGCARPPRPANLVLDPPSPEARERLCAWFGDERDGTLYFGEAAFWWASQQHGGDALADSRELGPKRIGRFDLASERMLPPLEVAQSGRTGVWDVLAHPNGRVYFTAYGELAGFVEPATGRVTLLPALGDGLNELALGPAGSILITRYGGSDGRGGAVLRVDEDGGLLAEFPVPGPADVVTAPKSVAYDALRDQIWINTDLFSRKDGSPLGWDARVLDGAGRELYRYSEPRLDFFVFAPDGTGHFAESDGSRLRLRSVPPDPALSTWKDGREVVLDEAFPFWLDVVQDLKPANDGSVVATRWTGHLYVVDPSGRVRAADLPPPERGGFYYTAVLHGNRVCATYCADVGVVCADLP